MQSCYVSNLTLAIFYQIFVSLPLRCSTTVSLENRLFILCFKSNCRNYNRNGSDFHVPHFCNLFHLLLLIVIIIIEALRTWIILTNGRYFTCCLIYVFWKLSFSGMRYDNFQHPISCYLEQQYLPEWKNTNHRKGNYN